LNLLNVNQVSPSVQTDR